jgi:hypothetical protein
VRPGAGFIGLSSVRARREAPLFPASVRLQASDTVSDYRMNHSNRNVSIGLYGRRYSLPAWPTPAVAFTLAFAAALLVALTQAPKYFYYDSGDYWSVGETFVSHGDFSLSNYASPLRGYLLPLTYHGLHGLARALRWSDSSAVKIFNALLLALIATVLAPKLAEATWPERAWSASRRLALLALLLIFWSGYLNFPLSDIPGLAVALAAIVVMSWPCSARSMLLAGAAIAAAVDVRPSYILLLAALPLLALLDLRGRPDRRRHAVRLPLYLGLAVASFALVSLPQSLAMHRHFRTYSFIPGAPEELESLQLGNGMELQLYGTYVGTGHAPEMNYPDATGAALLARQSLRQLNSTKYLELVLENPPTFAGIFARHLVNGLDLRYSTPYVERLSADWWLRVGGFLLVFIALLRVLWPRARRGLGKALWRYAVTLFACGATALPSAVETRYMLPLFVLCYLLVLTPGWPSPLPAGRTAPWVRYRAVAIILLGGLAFTGVVWHVVSATSATFQ